MKSSECRNAWAQKMARPAGREELCPLSMGKLYREKGRNGQTAKSSWEKKCLIERQRPPKGLAVRGKEK